MTKQQAIDLFGSAYKLAQALGISRQAVAQWPQELSRQREMAVKGAKTEQIISEQRKLEALQK